MFRNPLIDAAVVLLAVLLIFGPKRLPQLGRSLGQGMREFKDGITGHSKVDDDERPELTEATAAPVPPPAAAAAPPAQPVPPLAQPAPPPATEPAPNRESAPEVGSAEQVGSAEHRP
jgi:sec-independent protein translocase protein TatA